MSGAITPEELPQWMVGDIVLDSIPLNWKDIKLRRYSTPPQEVSLPELCDFSIVAYVNRGAINWQRDVGPWQTDRVGPGTLSVLTRSEISHWRWDSAIEAFHVYLPYNALAITAAEAFERDIKDIELKNVLAVQDTFLTDAALRLANEASATGLGGRLYVEALRCQISVHILRGYATVAMREHDRQDGMSQAQRKRIIEYIDENIARTIALAELAALVNLSVFRFSRRFQAEFNCPPYSYVLQRRLEYAKQQLCSKNLPIKAIAANSGFADQSHMTRLFKRTMNVTPAQYRRQAS
ncbi:MAG: AraC family transcriptional regulator [Rhizobiales bacterium]|nr:AraC family transcriptional regulator [Hyphomicrobiales bacterium]|tara:strand:- start:6981 stop:7865 length:885 start_codon:yes stop_codon:yes gene_type:complete